jgi:multidrug efflux pump subunit AcrA (membrane-fusion protein)
MFFSNGDEPLETMVVEAGEFLQQVSVSGKIVAAQEVDLAFSETGRVEALQVGVGDTVVAGQTLATLGISVLAADLRTAKSDLDKIRKEQDALVASAYRTLLSDDLAAVPSASSNDATPPTITGIYDGEEGSYRIRVTREENSSDYELRTFELESTGPTEILDDEPTALGTRGLFIAFPDGQAAYMETIWYVTIPNTKSTSYLANYNAYQEALRAREKAITAAEASIERIDTEISERVLRAPFSGVVTVVDTEVGATAATNEPVISLIGNDTLQIESFVPEINLPLVQPGASSTVTLDAYGSSVPFEAVVVSVDPAETVRDGVSTYRAILEFVHPDERIRSGMTANVVITADRRDNVISIPQRAVAQRDGTSYVRVMHGETPIEREVTTGAVSSIGSVEIVSGLAPGDILVLSQ